MTDSDVQKNSDLSNEPDRQKNADRQKDSGAHRDTGTQNEPIQEGSYDASRGEKVAGLLSQIAADLALRPHEDVSAQVRLRLGEAGIPTSEDEIEALTRDIVAAR